MRNKVWTDEEIDEVRQLIEYGGGSRAEIAVRFGVTRNAMIGLCYRNGIGRKTATVRHSEKSVERKPKMSVPKSAPAAPAAPIPAQPYAPPLRAAQASVLAPIVAVEPKDDPVPADGIGLLELRLFSCRWPLWPNYESGDKYCGQRAGGKTPLLRQASQARLWRRHAVGAAGDPRCDGYYEKAWMMIDALIWIIIAGLLIFAARGRRI